MVPPDDDWPAEIKKLLESLSDFERRVLFLRFGFDRGEPRTLEEVGEALGLSRLEVRAIEAKAFQRLQTDPKSD